MKRFILLLTMAMSIMTANSTDHSSNSPANKAKKKVVVISSSPRKGGNSDLLCDEFARGAREAGHQVEKIYLPELNIGFLRVNDNYSLHNVNSNDDGTTVLQKMVDADVIVLGTPTFYDNMSGHMKNLIDRTFEREHDMKNKEFYFIISAAGSNTTCTLLGFRNFIHYMHGAKERGVILGVGAYEKGEIKGKQSFKEAYEKGKGV